MEEIINSNKGGKPLEVGVNKFFLMNFIATILFIILQILFLPLAIIGFAYAYYKQIYGSKKLDVSSTAVEIINGRWIMDVFDIRKDAVTVKLYNVLPNE